jgi:AcrR family transcriptional regulator
MDLRREQKAERRERILTTARQRIGERGYEALTMRDLARGARVTVPTIYNLIGGKEAVLFAAIEEQTAQFLASIDRAQRSSPVSHALSVVESCATELLRLPDYYRTLLAILLSLPAARAMRDLVDTALTGEFERALEAMEGAGELASWANPRALARSLGSQLEYTSMRWASGELDAESLRPAAVYGVGLMLLAVSEGGSRQELGLQVRSAQDRIERRRSSVSRGVAGGGALGKGVAG